jgi:gamma-glutamyltranspeptidase/glutathione hydrolase
MLNILEGFDLARLGHNSADYLHRLAGSGVALESAVGADVRAGLTARGHTVRSGIGMWGGFQGILIDPKSGVLMGGSDPRKDGLAIGF